MRGDVLDRRNARQRIDDQPQGQDDNHRFMEADPDTVAGFAVWGRAKGA